eukprot:maker-scaffold_11-snap-gene-12.13-mRNA-1 protein AED:0.10 eAED:0.10 QI:19/1/1/1/1/1/2/25/710
MTVTEDILIAYQTFIPTTNTTKQQPTPEELNHAKELAAKRKAFLKEKAKELNMSAQKLEKNITKQLKKQKNNNKPKIKEKNNTKLAKSVSKEENEEEKEETSSTTLQRELKPPTENVGRGGYYVNSPEILKKHLNSTGSNWRTRFPPEPNGYLHIGHAKAMYVSFGTAKRNKGQCIMRFDDTNPQGEKQEYIDSIKKNVKWLKHKYMKMTYTSDYFSKLYEIAIELIQKDKAYVCHQTGDEIKKSRELLVEFNKNLAASESKQEVTYEDLPKGAISPYRNRSIYESLALFERMRRGGFAEGEATLRMKQDLLSPNANMWDQTAYRVIMRPHPRTGDSWCIYPTYDYSHALVDSLENVTHSLCSLEFESRQSIGGPYHWLLDALGMYHAQTWEFSRCSISRNVMSKRRLKRLVMENIVSGWDDPRLLTLDGMRRRGFGATGINTFCESIGVARSSNTVCIKYGLLEHFVREELNEVAERRFGVVDPIKVTFTNLNETVEISLPKFPHKPDEGTRKLVIENEVYIPRRKIRGPGEEVEKGFKGIKLHGFAKLLYGFNFKCIQMKEEDGIVKEIVCEKVDEEIKKVSTIAWVNVSTAVELVAREYEPLFIDCEVDGIEVHAEKAAKAKGVDFTELLNPNSLVEESVWVEKSVADEMQDCLNPEFLQKVETGDTEMPHWQFITNAYYCMDKDSTKDKLVVNRIVPLKESKTLRK